MPYRTVSIALGALLLTGAAQGAPPLGDVKPLAPKWPTDINGDAPLGSMAEYRGHFTLRGLDPDWVGDVRTGQMRIRLAGEPDRILALTEPTPCYIRGCAGATRFGVEGFPALLFDKAPCRLASGASYPYAVTVIFRRGQSIERKLTGCAKPGREAIAGVSIPETASPPPKPPRAPTANDARQALDREAASLMATPNAIAPRDWHWLKGISEGDGAVGRLHDLCTGAVEPKPSLSIGTWEWETLDPRMLNAQDRKAVLKWRAQLMGATYGCGTVFVIGTLGNDARKAAGKCPAGISVTKAFVDYVSRRPGLRRGDDPLKVTMEALRDAGCQ